MKQVIQNYRTGQMELANVPAPLCGDKEVLVENKNSLISIGTERLMIGLAKKSLLQKAKDRPDLVMQVINKVKTEGLMEAYRQSMARLDEPVPLGYSSAGVVKEAGRSIGEFIAGDRVACAGHMAASHAEVVNVPQNLCVRIPPKVTFEEAAFVSLGAIALHAVRVSDIKIGENVALIGLGLLGQIALQMLKASGCHVLGMDLDPKKLELAKSFGIDEIASPDNLLERSKAFTNGIGFDSVIIFASADSNQPIEQAAQIARPRGKIVAPGMIKLDLPRKIFYEKELQMVISRSSGPGIYDEQYEKRGIDYPISYVRWTEKRNMEAFLSLVAQKLVNLQPLISHRFNIDDALPTYERILAGNENFVGVLLQYPQNQEKFSKKIIINDRPSNSQSKVKVGLIGAGLFAKGTVFPILEGIRDIELVGASAASGFQIEQSARKLGFKYATTDYRRVLEDKEINTLVILAPHNLHAKFICEALQSGKNVFCEKPLCLNEDQLQEIIAARNSSRGILMIGFNRRFSPAAEFLKKEFASCAPLVLDGRVNVGPIAKESWTHNPDVGGGNIIGEVCHFIDLIQYFTGSFAQKVNAYSIASPSDDIFSEDNVVINIKTANGSVANITYTTLGDKSYPREKLEIFGAGRAALLDNFSQAQVNYQGKKNILRSFGVDRGHKKEYENFFIYSAQGAAPLADFKGYIAATLATFAIVKSLKTGAPQEINLDKYL